MVYVFIKDSIDALNKQIQTGLKQFNSSYYMKSFIMNLNKDVGFHRVLYVIRRYKTDMIDHVIAFYGSNKASKQKT